MIRNRSSGRSPQWLARVLGPGTQELSCEECFEALDREIELAAGGPEAWLPAMRAHLEGCPACREVGVEREQALAELHVLLLGAARFALTHRGAQPGREGFEDLAVQAADDALLTVLARLDDYRGESRFTTWAWKFAFYEACVVLRKRRWLEREVPSDAAGWDELSREAESAVRAEQAEPLEALRRGSRTC